MASPWRVNPDLAPPSVILRVCNFFDVRQNVAFLMFVKNRYCKQNSYDDELVINSKKSQTLSVVGRFTCESTNGVEGPLAADRQRASRLASIDALVSGPGKSRDRSSARLLRVAKQTLRSGMTKRLYGAPYNCLYTLALRRMACTYSRVSVNGMDSTNSCGSRYFPCPSQSSTRFVPAL